MPIGETRLFRTRVSPSWKKRALGTAGGAKEKNGASSSTPKIWIAFTPIFPYFCYSFPKRIWCIDIMRAFFQTRFVVDVWLLTASVGWCCRYFSKSIQLISSSRTTSLTTPTGTYKLLFHPHTNAEMREEANFYTIPLLQSVHGNITVKYGYHVPLSPCDLSPYCQWKERCTWNGLGRHWEVVWCDLLKNHANFGLGEKLVNGYVWGVNIPESIWRQKSQFGMWYIQIVLLQYNPMNEKGGLENPW